MMLNALPQEDFTKPPSSSSPSSLCAKSAHLVAHLHSQLQSGCFLAINKQARLIEYIRSLLWWRMSNLVLGKTLQEFVNVLLEVSILFEDGRGKRKGQKCGSTL